MNLYVQILTQVQTPDVVQLLLFPCHLQSDQFGFQAKVSAGGKLRRHSFESIDRIVAKIGSSKFNQLEVTYTLDQEKKSRLPAKVVSIVGVLTPSPTCELWFKSENWPAGGDRAMRARKMNAKAAEIALSYYKVSRKPSVFEVAIEIDTSDQHNTVLDFFATWLVQFMSKELEPLSIFGCVDAGGPELFVKLESNVLMTSNIRIMAKILPPTYPELGRRFDALHPVMFGAKSVCERIGLALGKNARVIRSSSLRDFAALRLAADCDAINAASRVSDWLIPSE